MCAKLCSWSGPPFSEQINFAEEREVAAPATFRLGDAMFLPVEDNTFDIAVMALVIFLVPDPVKGVS